MRWTNCQIKFCESKTIIEGIHRKRVGFPRDECRSGKIWAENIGFPQVSIDTQWEEEQPSKSQQLLII